MTTRSPTTNTTTTTTTTTTHHHDDGDDEPTMNAAGGGKSPCTSDPTVSATPLVAPDRQEDGAIPPSALSSGDGDTVELKVDIHGHIEASPSKDSSVTSIPSISSPQSSPFRRSLDEEHRAKEMSRKELTQKGGGGGGGGARQIFSTTSASSTDATTTNENEEDGNYNKDEGGGGGIAVDPKRLLRQSIRGTGEALTEPERNFLEMLLESNDPGIDAACAAAHERLMDGNLFAWNACLGGDDGCAGGEEEAPPRRLTSENIRQDDSVDWLKGSNDECVRDWALGGGTDDPGRGGRGNDARAGAGGGETELVDGARCSPAIFDAGAFTRGEGTGPPAADPLAMPYPFGQRRSSEARLSRLVLRKGQSSSGSDSNRLFRAHEAGLIVTPQGSARRSLMKMGMKMGLPMEKGLYIPNLPLPTNDDADDGERGTANDDPSAAAALAGILRDTNYGGDFQTATFEKALAKMDERTIRRIEKEGQKALAKVDERTIRRIEKEERAKDRQLTTQPTPMAGCASPFSINVLRSMFASKQMTFRQSSSSYTRFDSFLVSTEASEPGILTTDSSSVPENGEKNDIFRPSTMMPSASEERFKNLLINAGFRDEADDGYNDELVDAKTEDDDEILRSPSNNSVAMLTKGGPSYRDVNMFRESPPDKRKPDESNIEKVKTASESPSLDEVKESASDEAKVSPATSEIGDLPSALSKSLPSGLSNSLSSLPPLLKRSSLSQSLLSSTASRERSNTATSIIKPTMSPSRKGRYSRSVSWGHMVLSKEEEKAATTRREALASMRSESGLSILSFPHLRMASPLRSDSIGSVTSSVMSLQPLRLGAPIRSDSTTSNSSMPSPHMMLAHAHPVLSPMTSFMSIPPPALTLARAVRSESQSTMGANIDDEGSLNLVDFVAANPNLPKGAAWENSLRPARNHTSSSDSVSCRELGVFIRQASQNCYEGMGMEVEELHQLDSIDNARKYQSMVSVDCSTRSFRTRSFSRQRSSSIPTLLPIKAFDDSFTIRNIDFERHSSEILRSLSNEDLYSSHHLQTVNGGNSTARVNGDLLNDGQSWDLESSNSFGAANAWGVLEDEYAEGVYFQILGTSANDVHCHPHVLSPPLMESLQNFFPPSVSDHNFWLKYSLVRDGASLPSLLRHIRGTKHTLIAIETVEGEVFGSYTSSPWRKNWNYYGNGESFLWRMRRSRSEKDAQYSVLDQAKLESELDVFQWTGSNDLVQYCSHDIMAIGGGSLREDNRDDGPDEQRELPPQSPAFTKANKGGFGLAIDSELLRGTSSSCATFDSPPLSKFHPNGPFEILNIEVWTLTPCANIREAENLEMTTLFLETYNREI